MASHTTRDETSNTHTQCHKKGEKRAIHATKQFKVISSAIHLLTFNSFNFSSRPRCSVCRVLLRGVLSFFRLFSLLDSSSVLLLGDRSSCSAQITPIKRRNIVFLPFFLISNGCFGAWYALRAYAVFVFFGAHCWVIMRWNHSYVGGPPFFLRFFCLSFFSISVRPSFWYSSQ